MTEYLKIPTTTEELSSITDDVIDYLNNVDDNQEVVTEILQFSETFNVPDYTAWFIFRIMGEYNGHGVLLFESNSLWEEWSIKYKNNF